MEKEGTHLIGSLLGEHSKQKKTKNNKKERRKKEKIVYESVVDDVEIARKFRPSLSGPSLYVRTR